MILDIKNCRMCKSTDLVEVVNLGTQCLTGVFPKSAEENVLAGPLALVWCSNCDLVQLKHRYPPEEMYGENYGYRSGLNSSMVEHLSNKANELAKIADLRKGDSVLDIGSNDGTLLRSYDIKSLNKVGIDPTAEKFREFYDSDIEVISDFFSAQKLGEKKFKAISSISMFYDLDDPLQFVHEIKECLHPMGIWHFEQSYMPSMIRQISYDTICHEHLEYYSLTPVEKILTEAGLRIIEIKMNSVNGGSFAVTACHADSYSNVKCELLEWLIQRESSSGYSTPWPYREFEKKVFEHRESLIALIQKINESGKTIHAYGASTKGNVLLQFCGITPDQIPYAAEINPYKYGRFTPGSKIPIVSAEESLKMKPDYYLVLPWHFRDGIIKKEREFLNSGGKMIFPLPEIEII